MLDVKQEKIVISVGGHFGSVYQLALNNGELSYTQIFDDREKAQVQVIVPDSKKWQRFWKRIDAIGVWNWDSRYENPYVMDGTSWLVDIMYNGKHVSSSGSNAYPGGEATKDFDLFLQAIRDLIGDKPFA
jgi:hypothetical protein